jgi:hypothetical protein
MPAEQFRPLALPTEREKDRVKTNKGAVRIRLFWTLEKKQADATERITFIWRWMRAGLRNMGVGTRPTLRMLLEDKGQK